MRALSCLLMVGVAAMLAAGCEPTKNDVLQPAGTDVKAAAYPEGQTPALEPPPVAVTPPVTKEVTTPTASTKTKTATTPTAVKTKTKTATTPTVEKTKLPAGAKEYKVVKGDTLSGIAKKFYSDATLWKKIADANTGKVHDKDKIYIGSTLVIPAK